MIWTTALEVTVAGAKMEMGVDYTHDPGEPESHDSPGLKESVEIFELFFLDPSEGDHSDLILNDDQYAAVMQMAGGSIREVCFADAADRLKENGYVKRDGAWVRGKR